MTPAVAEEVYRARAVDKRYGGVHALRDANLTLRSGEVHALLGANGAGKSTLVKIIAGAEQPSSGTLYLRGEELSLANTEDAARVGVALVSQELNLFPELTALDNLFLMREPLAGGVFVDRRKMRRMASEVVEVVGLDVDLGRKVATLRLGERQLLEIARALLGEPSILVLDEPTSALQTAETSRLLEVVEVLRDRGVAILFVSHFLEDVFRIADKVTILRGGRVVLDDRPASSLSVTQAVREILGEEGFKHSRALQEGGSHTSPSESNENTETAARALRFEGVSIDPGVRDVTFTAPVGSVVGLAGLEGSGAGAVMRAVFGEARVTGGRVTLPNGRSAPRSIVGAVRAGVAFVPADRKAIGLMLTKSIADNIVLVNGGPLKRMGIFLRKSEVARRADQWRERLGIKMQSPWDPVDSLSGGNQQKVVFAKWLEVAPEVMLLDDPTRGVDVGAKLEMQRLIREAARDKVVLYRSNDFEEMVEVCDRVLLFFDGDLRAEFGRGKTEHEILEAVNSGHTQGGPGADGVTVRVPQNPEIST